MGVFSMKMKGLTWLHSINSYSVLWDISKSLLKNMIVNETALGGGISERMALCGD